MKQKFLLKSLLLLCALVVGSSSVWAGTYVKVASASDLVSGETYVIAEISESTKYLVTGYGSKLKNVTSGFSVSSNTITTSTAEPLEFTLGKVGDNYTLKYSSTDYLGYSGSSTNFETATSTSNAKEQWVITSENGFTIVNASTVSASTVRHIGRNSANIGPYSTSYTACYLFKKQSTTTPEVSLSTASLAFGRVKAGSTKELTFTITPSNLTSDLSIACNNGKYSLSASSIAQATTEKTTITVTASPTSTTDDMTGAITISGGGLSESKSVTLSCIVRDPDANDGTAAKPYTVAEALELIDEEGSDKTGIYVKGMISQIDEVSVSNKNATYWISDNGSTTNQLEVFRGKYLDGADFTSEDQINLFDNVIVVGDLTKFGTTYEFTTGSELASLTPDARAEAGLAWSVAEVEIDKGAADGEYTLPTLVNPNGVSPITYTITGTDDLAIEVGGEIAVDTDIEGSATITASFVGNSSYRPGSASYTITVIDKTKKGSIYNPYTVAEVIDGTATGSGIYVKGFIVGEYPSSGTTIKTSDFSTDANIALADEYSTSTPKASAIPVQISTDALKAAWGNKTNKGTTMGYQVVLKGNKDTYFSTNGIKGTSEVSAVTAPVKITAAEYATCAPKYALDFSTTGITVYTAEDKETSVALNEVTTGKIPANTPVVLYKAGADGSAINVPVIASAEAIEGTNDLRVSTGTDVENMYVLAKNPTIGFYPWGGTNLSAGKIYLQGKASYGAREFIGFGDATGIDSVTRDALKNGKIYNLQGQEVKNATKGIFIVNGKKVFLK